MKKKNKEIIENKTKQKHVKQNNRMQKTRCKCMKA